MRLLLDTHVLVALARPRRRELGGKMREAIASPANTSFVSAASLWEIAIKWRLGKLEIEVVPDDLARYFDEMGMSLLAIDHRHAVAKADPEPATRDPFDRMLLAQCAVENMKLVTTDGALSSHPLSWRPA
jgi:PIN domain nuclease of toxin-antitoxin system